MKHTKFRSTQSGAEPDDPIRIWPAVVLAVVGFLALGGFLIVIALDPGPENLLFEVGKALLQLVTVTVVGGMVTWCLLYLNGERERSEKRREHQRLQAQKLRDEQRAAAETALAEARAAERHNEMTRREELQRELQRERDMRTRKDEFLRSILDEEVDAYQDVKRSRRLLRARLREGSPAIVQRDVYDSHIAQLSDCQLRFELLATTSSLLDDARVDRRAIQGSIRSIEVFLNGIVGEYERVRSTLSMHGSELTRVDELISKDHEPFLNSVSRPHNEIVRQLRHALLEPSA